MSEEIKLLIFIGLTIFCSPFIAGLLRLPVLAVEILIGSLCASFGLISDSHSYELASHIGFCFLMFLAGLEVSLRDFFKLKGAFFRKILFFYIILYAISSLWVKLFGLSYIFAIVAPAMSVGLVAILYQDFNGTNEWLDSAMIIAALGEVVTILLVTIINSFASGHTPIIAVLALVAFLGGFLLIFYLLKCLFWWFPRIKGALIPQASKAEQGIRSALALWILAIALMLICDFELALGAFLAGVYIASFYDDAHALEERLCAIGYGLLVPIFFTHVGLSLDLFHISKEVIKFAAILCVFMLIIRLIASLVFYKDFGLKCLLMGSSTTMPLTLLIAIATLGQRINLINNEQFAAMVLCALFQAIIIMWLLPKIALRFETKQH